MLAIVALTVGLDWNAEGWISKSTSIRVGSFGSGATFLTRPYRWSAGVAASIPRRHSAGVLEVGVIRNQSATETSERIQHSGDQESPMQLNDKKASECTDCSASESIVFSSISNPAFQERPPQARGVWHEPTPTNSAAQRRRTSPVKHLQIIQAPSEISRLRNADREIGARAAAGFFAISAVVPLATMTPLSRRIIRSAIEVRACRLVGDDNDCHAKCFFQLQNQLVDAGRDDRIESGGRFVEEQDLRVHGERARDCGIALPSPLNCAGM